MASSAASTADAQPPSYEQVIGSSKPTHETRNGIPPDRRRSMEDEHRYLPAGWVRQYDSNSGHQFFVDTTKEPPRSIWHHPYDDNEYLNTLSQEERYHVTHLHRSVSLKDLEAESSDDEHGHTTGKAGTAVAAKTVGESSHQEPPPTGIKKFGRKLKDKVTHSTHEEREREREKRAQEEEEAYRMHLAFRNALSEAARSGKPQKLGVDRNGKELWVEPPNRRSMAYGGQMGYDPYNPGPYSNNNAMYMRPAYPYRRPMGYGYGGGLGLPIAGGLLGGALLGGLLF